MNQALEDYILAHIEPEPDNLRQLDRDTHLRLLYPRMCSGHIQGRLLKMLTRMINPTHVLELGTYSAYASLCLAEGLSDDHCSVDTIEIDDELEDFILQHLAQSPFGNRVTLHIGDALDIVPKLGKTFDLVYIDANKRHYPQYYKLVMPHLKTGGFIIADNTLWDGKVAEPEHKQSDRQTQGILEFNRMVAQDPSVEVVIIPLRDGISLIRKK